MLTPTEGLYQRSDFRMIRLTLKAFCLLMGAQETISMKSPTLHTSSSSCAKNFLVLLTLFPASVTGAAHLAASLGGHK